MTPTMKQERPGIGNALKSHESVIPHVHDPQLFRERPAKGVDGEVLGHLCPIHSLLANRSDKRQRRVVLHLASQVVRLHMGA